MLLDVVRLCILVTMQIRNVSSLRVQRMDVLLNNAVPVTCQTGFKRETLLFPCACVDVMFEAVRLCEPYTRERLLPCVSADV